jgi:hypothetical protein
MKDGPPPPWLLEPDGSAGWILREIANRIVKDPTAMVAGTSPELLSQGIVGRMTTIRHGNLKVHLPTIEGWTVDTSNASDIVSTLRELSDACHGYGSHRLDLHPVVTNAVMNAIVSGVMPDGVVTDDGCHTVELCVDETTSQPVLYVAITRHGEDDMVPIPITRAPGMPAFRIPCMMHERQDTDMLVLTMCFAVNDTDGIVFDDVKVDAMEVLRFARSHSTGKTP